MSCKPDIHEMPDTKSNFQLDTGYQAKYLAGYPAFKIQ